jgi:hypothetical protein
MEKGPISSIEGVTSALRKKGNSYNHNAEIQRIDHKKEEH